MAAQLFKCPWKFRRRRNRESLLPRQRSPRIQLRALNGADQTWGNVSRRCPSRARFPKVDTEALNARSGAALKHVKWAVSPGIIISTIATPKKALGIKASLLPSRPKVTSSKALSRSLRYFGTSNILHPF